VPWNKRRHRSGGEALTRRRVWWRPWQLSDILWIRCESNRLYLTQLVDKVQAMGVGKMVGNCYCLQVGRGAALTNMSETI
jgi:hypothetical protein